VFESEARRIFGILPKYRILRTARINHGCERKSPLARMFEALCGVLRSKIPQSFAEGDESANYL
jgi:hypothetical protein